MTGTRQLTVGDILGQLRNSDRIRIFRDEEEIYCDYLAMMEHGGNITRQELDDTVAKDFRVKIEIRHKKWKELGLMQPLMASETEQYNFSDLMLSLYYTFKI